jgi:hypothetical protein
VKRYVFPPAYRKLGIFLGKFGDIRGLRAHNFTFFKFPLIQFKLVPNFYKGFIMVFYVFIFIRVL